MSSSITVLIADDSATTRQMLTHLITNTPGMCVVGEAHDGAQAVQLTAELHPHLVLMDLTLPKLDGLAAIRQIMGSTPTPIVVVSSSLENNEMNIAFQAISAGALTTVQRPVGPRAPEHKEQVAALISTIRAMADVKVIRHWQRKERPQGSALPSKIARTISAATGGITAAPPQIVAVVASTGGPAALGEIVEGLPADFGLPVVIVQHIAPDFTESLQRWLATCTSLPVNIAQQHELPEAGNIYLAPGNAHLRIAPDLRFSLDAEPHGESHMPSGNILLHSVAAAYRERAIGVVLTGMGTDGARGLRAMYDMGAFTIAQDEATSVVFGMPREAATIGAIWRVLPLQEIAPTLTQLSRIKEFKSEDTHESQTTRSDRR